MGQQTDAQRRQYIHDFARTLMGQLRIKATSYSSGWADIDVRAMRRIVWQDHNCGIYTRLCDADGDLLGRIASCWLGNEEMEGISQETERWFSLKDTGRMCLIKIGTAALVAATADNLIADLKRLNNEETVPSG